MISLNQHDINAFAGASDPLPMNVQGTVLRYTFSGLIPSSRSRSGGLSRTAPLIPEPMPKNIKTREMQGRAEVWAKVLETGNQVPTG